LDITGLSGLDQAGANALGRFRRHIERGGGSMHMEGTTTTHVKDALSGPQVLGEALD
jgi:hypothetical protein